MGGDWSRRREFIILSGAKNPGLAGLVGKTFVLNALRTRRDKKPSLNYGAVARAKLLAGENCISPHRM